MERWQILTREQLTPFCMVCVLGGGGGLGVMGGGEMQCCLKMGPIDMTTF